jgi:hypothetical protein
MLLLLWAAATPLVLLLLLLLLRRRLDQVLPQMWVGWQWSLPDWLLLTVAWLVAAPAAFEAVVAGVSAGPLFLSRAVPLLWQQPQTVLLITPPATYCFLDRWLAALVIQQRPGVADKAAVAAGALLLQQELVQAARFEHAKGTAASGTVGPVAAAGAGTEVLPVQS